MKKDELYFFGTVLRDVRQQAGLTQEELGKLVGVPRTFISILESGNKQPRLGMLFRLASALNTRASVIIHLVEDKYRSN